MLGLRHIDQFKLITFTFSVLWWYKAECQLWWTILTRYIKNFDTEFLLNKTLPLHMWLTDTNRTQTWWQSVFAKKRVTLLRWTLSKKKHMLIKLDTYNATNFTVRHTIRWKQFYDCKCKTLLDLSTRFSAISFSQQTGAYAHQKSSRRIFERLLSIVFLENNASVFSLFNVFAECL